MDMYVRIFDDLEKGEGDNPGVGLIPCTEKDKTIVKYSVLNEKAPLFAFKIHALSAQRRGADKRAETPFNRNKNGAGIGGGGMRKRVGSRQGAVSAKQSAVSRKSLQTIDRTPHFEKNQTLPQGWIIPELLGIVLHRKGKKPKITSTDFDKVRLFGLDETNIT